MFPPGSLLDGGGPKLRSRESHTDAMCLLLPPLPDRRLTRDIMKTLDWCSPGLIPLLPIRLTTSAGVYVPDIDYEKQVF